MERKFASDGVGTGVGAGVGAAAGVEEDVEPLQPAARIKINNSERRMESFTVNPPR